MNYYSVFYWLTVADSVKKFFDGASNAFFVFTILTFIGYVITQIGTAAYVSGSGSKTEEEDKTDPTIRGWVKARSFFTKTFGVFLTLCLITWAGFVFTPTKKDCLLIVAGGAIGNFITKDSSARKIPADITNFLHLELDKQSKDLSTDLRSNLGLDSPKDKLLKKAESMSKEELIKMIQDSTIQIKQ